MNQAMRRKAFFTHAAPTNTVKMPAATTAAAKKAVSAPVYMVVKSNELLVSFPFVIFPTRPTACAGYQPRRSIERERYRAGYLWRRDGEEVQSHQGIGILQGALRRGARAPRSPPRPQGIRLILTHATIALALDQPGRQF